MKALLVITGLFPGGAERIVLETVRGLKKNGHEAAVVSLLKRPDSSRCAIVDELEKMGVRPFFLNLSRLHAYRIFRLLRIIRKESPDIVHSHLMHANLLLRLIRIFHPFPLVNTIHIAERRKTLETRILFLLDRLTFRLCDAYTAVSMAAARFHEQKCSLPSGTIRVIYNGSDPVKPKSAAELAVLRREWGLAGTQKLIGSIGRLDYQKGYDLLLRKLPDLKRLIPPGERWGILLIGDGPERTALQRIAAEMEQRIPQFRIVLPGYRPDAAELLPMLDLFVMPSRYEGFGLALTEALSQGIPVLCSRADSLPEICSKFPQNAFSVDFESPGMEKIFLHALTLPKSQGKIFRTTAEMTEEYLALYQEISNPSAK